MFNCITNYSLQLQSAFIQLYIFLLFTYTSPTAYYTLSLHDALPISSAIRTRKPSLDNCPGSRLALPGTGSRANPLRSEEHTSELQSHSDLVCRLLLEKKKNNLTITILATTSISRHHYDCS